MSTRTALITGASAGIGKAMAPLFAREGHDLVLVARGKDRLEALATELQAAHRVTAHVVAADLTDPAAPFQIFEETQRLGLTIDFLVNNAGFGSNGPFLDLSLSREAEMVEVNCAALLKLTHFYAGPMRQRGFGRVLNIASTAGFQPGPYMATYYASKAFVVSFSEALSHELRDTGVTVTCHCPGATHTEFAAKAGNDKTRLFQRSGVASADEVAAHAYAAMMRGKPLAIHGALNTLLVQSLRFSPRALVRTIAAEVNLPPRRLAGK